MNTPSFRNSSVRNSLIATTRPVSRRWKKLVTKIKAFRKHHATTGADMEEDDDEELDEEKLSSNNQQHHDILKSRTNIIRRRHSSDELSRKVSFPYYIEDEHGGQQKKKKKDSASLSAIHHISMPAGPVSSALSPPPRHTMTKRKITEPPTSRSPVLVRLSIDLREENENHLLASPESTRFSNASSIPSQRHHPFRSGTLGNNNDDPLFTIPTTPVPDIPLKERRKRRSPLTIPDDLTLSLNKKSSSTTSEDSKQRRNRQTFYYSYQHHPTTMPTSERRSSISSVTSSSTTSSSVISEERNKAMHALEGLDRDKAQYDAVVGRRRTNNNLTPTTTMHQNEPTPSLTPNSRPLYYPSSPSSVGTIVEESAKFTISAGAVCSSSSPLPPLSPQQLPPLPTSRIPESTMRQYRDL